MAAVIPVLKVVGIALSAKSAYEGIKEGNLLQAVVGAVGAYYGVSSLASSAGATAAETAATEVAEGAAQGAATAGAQATDKIAAEVAGSALESGGTLAKGAVRELGKSTVADLSNQSTTLVDLGGAGTAAIKGTAQELGKEAVKQTVTKEAGKGLLRSVGTFIENNPEVTQAGLNFVGGYAQGKAEEDLEKELFKRQQRIYDAQRERMGTPGNVSSATSIRWNPQTRQFERVRGFGIRSYVDSYQPREPKIVK